MRIIFLDFDGVVNAFNDPGSLRQLSKTCVETLNALIEKTNAYIVVTSTWRILHSMADLRQILINAGFKFPQMVVGKTPRGGRRGIEIEEWLKRFPPEDIESFVILDDDSDMEPFMDRLVQTNSDKGLTMNDVEKVINLFT